MLYVFSGKARSGKDTAVNILKNIIIKNGFTVLTIAYADFLKEILSKCFNLSEEHLYGIKKEEPVEWLPRNTGALLQQNVCWTPRELLQYLGTDVMRSIDPNCWINVVKNYVETYSNYDFILISDGRFVNELEWVIERGGVHIHIERNTRDFSNNNTHISETSLDSTTHFDTTCIVQNDTTLEDLYFKLENIWRKNKW